MARHYAKRGSLQEFIAYWIRRIMREGIRGRRPTRAQAVAVAYAKARAAGYRVRRGRRSR